MFNSVFFSFKFLPAAEEEYKPPPIKLTLPKPQMYPYPRAPLVAEDHLMEDQTWSTMLPFNPETATTVHEGGAVLKFKFGYYFTFVLLTNIKLILLFSSRQHQDDPMLGAEDKSVYDFHEGSDRDDDGMQLSIDDSPAKSRRQSASTSTGSLKVRLPGKCLF